ncbi:MAG TPA: phosphotransferase [Chloroflexota bacterium]|nr:phosphotransferase [Chloroflexota bacterium]
MSEPVSPLEGAALTPEGIAAELHEAGIIDFRLTQCVALTGGTASRVAALSRPGSVPQVVVKLNAPAVIQAEALFLRTYGASPLLPPLRHVDPAHRFLVCDFVSGVHIRYGEDRVDVAEVLLTLVRDLLSRYVPCALPAPADRQDKIAPVAELLEPADEGAGSPPISEKTSESGTTNRTNLAWPQFLGEHVAYRHKRLGSYLPAEDLRLVEHLARAPRRTEQTPLSLLHGDCGAHNFLFQQQSGHPGPLHAVLDPYPLVGYPIFDLAFAFVSWPNDLDLEAILPAAEALRASSRWLPNGDPRRILCEEVLIALYKRMGTCMVHHPRDLPAYLAAWPRWRRLAAPRPVT